MDDFERSIENFEKIVRDPDFDNLIRDIIEVNSMSAEGLTKKSDVMDYLHKLNARWQERSNYGQPLLVSGEVFIGGDYPDFDYDTTLDTVNATYYPKHTEINSQGFCVMAITNATDEGISTTYEIIGRGTIEVQRMSSDAGMQEVNCAFRINDHNLENVVITESMAQAWFEVYTPDILIEITNIIANSDDEAEATYKLANADLSVVGMDSDRRKELATYLDTYLNRTLVYDVHVPYAIEIAGPCEIRAVGFVEYQKAEIVTNNLGLLQINEIQVVNDASLDSLSLQLSGLFIHHAKRSSTAARVPLTSIITLQSGRDHLTRSWESSREIS